MYIFCCSFDYRTILSFMKDLEQNTPLGSDSGTATSEWAPASRAASAPNHPSRMDDLQAAGLVPTADLNQRPNPGKSHAAAIQK